MTVAERPLLDTIKSLAHNAQAPNILDIFKSEAEIEGNESGKIASYLITTSKGDDLEGTEVLLFFSLRCGELFKQSLTMEQIHLAIDAFHAYNIYQRKGQELDRDEQSFLLGTIEKAVESGIALENLMKIACKKR